MKIALTTSSEAQPEPKQITMAAKNSNYIKRVEDNYVVQSTNSKIDEITGIPNNLSLTFSNNFVRYEDDLNNLHLSHALLKK